MIEDKDANRSLLLPKWHSMLNIGAKEYSSLNEKKYSFNENTIQSFQEEYQDFKSNPTYTKACNLIGSSVILNEDHVSKEISAYLYKNPNNSFSIESLIRKVSEGFNIENQGMNASERIRFIRSKLPDQPKNSLLWLELARQYTAKGLNKKAKRYIEIAYSLAPTNRYIVRSVARFFIHIKDVSQAQKITEKAYKLTDDPWIRSTAINCAILNNMKLSKLNIIQADTIEGGFHYSELLASSAMVDIRMGNDKRAKKLLKLAWKAPTEIVIANAEWIFRNIFPNMRNDEYIDYSKSTEASAWENYYSLQLNEAIENAVLWSLDEPYSTHPFSCGSGFACTANNYGEAIRIAKEGLIANPQDILLKNNLIFSYLKSGNIFEAEKIIDRIDSKLIDDNLVYLTATYGLYNYMIGKIDTGRKLYIKAYNLSKEKKNEVTSMKVVLNHAIAEKTNVEKPQKEILEKADRESRNTSDPGIFFLRKEYNNL